MGLASCQTALSPVKIFTYYLNCIMQATPKNMKSQGYSKQCLAFIISIAEGVDPLSISLTRASPKASTEQSL